MWKLSPDSWVDKSGRYESWRVAEVTALANGWRERLYLAIARLAPGKLQACDADPLRALRTLSGRVLLALDDVLRHGPSHSEHLAKSRLTLQFTVEDDGMADAYLFVASCHGVGFIRQKALDSFTRYPGALALAAGLIRSTDWVAQVREAGIALVTGVLPRLAPSDVVRSLDLIACLGARARASSELWQSAVLPVLATPAGRQALREAFRAPSSSRDLRRAVLEFLWDDGDVLIEAVGDQDQLIGLRALDRIERLDDRERGIALLKVVPNASHASVRQKALRLYAATRRADCAEVLRARLFDPARGVRGFAAYELKRSYGEDVLPVWRAQIDSADRRRAEIAMLSLCELGERGDVEKLVDSDSVRRRSSRIRSALLRGLLRVASPRLESSLAVALFDRSSLVVRELSQIYRRASLPLDAASIDAALAAAPDSLVPNLLTLGQLLGKWEEIEFLLRHSLDEPPARAACAAHRIDRWVLTEGRRFTVPSSEQLRRLAPLLVRAQASHAGRYWGSIAGALKAFAAEHSKGFS